MEITTLPVYPKKKFLYDDFLLQHWKISCLREPLGERNLVINSRLSNGCNYSVGCL